MIVLSNTQRRAARITRSLFASLPFAVRLAFAFSVLAGTDIMALGRALGVILIKKGVTGLPDVHGKPALEFPVAELEAQHKDPSRLIPRDYLQHFSADLRLHLISKFHSEQLVDVVISNWLFRFIVEGGWKNMHEGISLSQARSYVMASLDAEALNEIKKGKSKKRDMGSLDISDESGKALINPADPEAPTKFYENLPISEMPKVRKILEEKAHPDAPLYLDLLLEGYSSAEILGFEGGKQIREPMLPHMRDKNLNQPYKTWKTHVEPKIRKVLQKAMSDAA